MLLPMVFFAGCSNESDQEVENGSDQEIENESDQEVENGLDQEIENESDLMAEDDECVPNHTVYPPQHCPILDDSFAAFAGSFEYGNHGYFAYRHLEFMQDNLPNRLPFTYRELETAEWIVSELLEMGFSEDDIEMPEFAVADIEIESLAETVGIEFHQLVDGQFANYEAVGYLADQIMRDYSQNVILTLPGESEQVIIVGAHYDSPGQVSISDNAAGVALLLESAYRMREVDHYYTIQYVFFGAEEAGLVGALHFTLSLTDEELDNIVLMINADVILDGPDLIYATGYINPPEDDFERGIGTIVMLIGNREEVHNNDITRNIDEIANDLNSDYDLELIAKPSGVFAASDHLAFLELGLPILAFYATHPAEYPVIFSGEVFHSAYDDLHIMNEMFPGRIERALQSYSLFLEQILLPFE